MPNLIILSQVNTEKSLTEDVLMHCIRVRDGTIENLKKKEGKNIAKSEQSSHTPGGSHQRPL